ncbi:unnamed protein product [Caenorhabditis sp. 36 PRJEB53466]|nr:unnamed protein product [Caenorhabditis sp. 36 PRJEB53466]
MKDLNVCCAVWNDCIEEKKGETYCNKQYYGCNQNVLSSASPADFQQCRRFPSEMKDHIDYNSPLPANFILPEISLSGNDSPLVRQVYNKCPDKRRTFSSCLHNYFQKRTNTILSVFELRMCMEMNLDGLECKQSIGVLLSSFEKKTQPPYANRIRKVEGRGSWKCGMNQFDTYTTQIVVGMGCLWLKEGYNTCCKHHRECYQKYRNTERCSSFWDACNNVLITNSSESLNNECLPFMSWIENFKSLRSVYFYSPDDSPCLLGLLMPTDISLKELYRTCPMHTKALDYCQSKSEDCHGQIRPLEECNKQFCQCLQDAGPKTGESRGMCDQHMDNLCFAAWKFGGAYRKEVVEKQTAPVRARIRKNLDPLSEPFMVMQKQCLVETKVRLEVSKLKKKLNLTDEVFDSILPYLTIQAVESSMLRSKGCQTAKVAFEKAMEAVDAKTTSNMHIPYEFWYPGTEFGAVGKVIFRVVANEACEKAALDFNHLSAVHLNCYDQQLPRDQCDTDYFESMRRTLSTMDSKKVSCKMFVNAIESVLPIRAEQFFKEAAEFHGESSSASVGGKFNRGFQGFLNGSMTKRDTKNAIFVLEASEKSSLRMRDYFDYVSKECGKVRRFAAVVSSCGFKYEYCVEYVKSDCSIQLAICLGDIEDMSDSCQYAIGNVTETIWPTVHHVQATPTNILSGSFSANPFVALFVVVVMTSIVAVTLVFALVANKHHKSSKDLPMAHVNETANEIANGSNEKGEATGNNSNTSENLPAVFAEEVPLLVPFLNDLNEIAKETDGIKNDPNGEESVEMAIAASKQNNR